jgi:hypothetical protein
VVGLVDPGWVQTDMGGPHAQISVQESATGLRTLAAGWSLEDSTANSASGTANPTIGEAFRQRCKHRSKRAPVSLLRAGFSVRSKRL